MSTSAEEFTKRVRRLVTDPMFAEEELDEAVTARDLAVQAAALRMAASHRLVKHPDDPISQCCCGWKPSSCNIADEWRNHIISLDIPDAQLALDKLLEDARRETIFELHKSHRRHGEFNFGVSCAIAELSIEEMNQFRKTLMCAIGTAEDMFRREIERRNPASSALPLTSEPADSGGKD